ncbi:MAG: PstS family phosphate ABC transporter substrate-binding protein [Bdellovibrionales bacterium]|nr:PstS family phosphate ABC transporter substrate-binding protein [Bdellovibrionales bacterium]
MSTLAACAAFSLISLPAFSADLKGSVMVDGSSTVFPITEAIAEEFNKEQSGVRVTIGVSGTGGGFKKFCGGETDISNASREIKKEETESCASKGVKYVKLPVAYDGITVVVNPKNSWAKDITVAELKKIWEPESKVMTWKQVRASWPDKALKLYGPGTDSGTFDYFTEAVNGKSHVSRADFTKSEDDNVLVTGVSGDEGAMGYFGFAYYQENKGKLKALHVDNGKGAVEPTLETIKTMKYAPLSRPVFIYVSVEAAKKKPEVREFVKYYMENAADLVKDVGYIPMPAKEYQAGWSAFQAQTGAQVGAR